MFNACFTLIVSWEGGKNIRVGIHLNKKLLKVGLQDTSNLLRPKLFKPSNLLHVSLSEHRFMTCRGHVTTPRISREIIKRDFVSYSLFVGNPACIFSTAMPSSWSLSVVFGLRFANVMKLSITENEKSKPYPRFILSRLILKSHFNGGYKQNLLSLICFLMVRGANSRPHQRDLARNSRTLHKVARLMNSRLMHITI